MQMLIACSRITQGYTGVEYVLLSIIVIASQAQPESVLLSQLCCEIVG